MANVEVLPVTTADRLQECYYGDEYPREGCSVTFRVRSEASLSMAVYAPNGKPLESYLVPPEMAGKFMDEWLAGRVPSRFSRPVQSRPEFDKAG